MSTEEEFAELRERIDALEEKSFHRIPKTISLFEVFSSASGGARAVLLYIVIAAIGLPVGALFWLMGMLGDNPANARSMITIVFCMGTMAIAGLLATVAIRKDQLDKAKEVLIILIGIFGTIVGYYFGSSELPKKEVDVIVSQKPPQEPEANKKSEGKKTEPKTPTTPNPKPKIKPNPSPPPKQEVEDPTPAESETE